jgi:hypothetical protein
MKISEITESYTDDLYADLDNILADAKARGLFTVETEDVVNLMLNMGYSVDRSSILSALGMSPYVSNADKSKIVMHSPQEQTPPGEDSEENKEKVNDMAIDTATKDIM